MSRIVTGMTFVLLLGALPVLGQDKGKGGKPDPRNQQDLTPLVNASATRGRVARIHNASSFTLEVFETKSQPGGKGGRPRVVTTRRPYILDMADDVVVRIMQLPLQFDDMGKPRKHTEDELKELRGDNPNLPGYKSTIDSLRVGQTVDISLRRFQPPAPRPNPTGEKDKQAQPNNSPRVTIVVILSDGDSVAAAQKEDRLKKKKK